jgi:cyanophycin synthetase
VEGLAALVEKAKPGDVVGLMCHEDRQGVYAWLEVQGFTVDSPETLRHKVRSARGSSE